MSAYRGCDIPPELYYDVPHDVWVRLMADGTVTLGMTDVAQTRSGKVLHILFKKIGRHLEPGQSAATIESAKWAGPFPTPLGGTIVDTNEASFRQDLLIANRDPYGAGWLVRLKPDDWSAAAGGLMTGEQAVLRYEARVDELDLSCFRCAD